MHAPNEPSRWPGAALPLAGELIAGKYRVECVLAKSEQAILLAAHDEVLDRPIALKILPGMREKRRAARFLREARTAARLESDHVVKILDVGTTKDDTPFIVLERLEGVDLAMLLERDGPLPVERVADYAIQACMALAHAHAEGIVHRDIKPQNLFLAARADGSTIVKLLDFGIAKAEDARGDEATLTSSYALLGSPAFMSPEQIQRPRDVDGRADIWSLGVVMYRLLTGNSPFTGDTLPLLVRSVLEGLTVPPSSRRADLPPQIDAVVMRCILRDREQRFPNVLALARALAPLAPPRAVELVRGIAFVSGDRDASVRDPAPALAPAPSLSGTASPFPFLDPARKQGLVVVLLAAAVTGSGVMMASLIGGASRRARVPAVESPVPPEFPPPPALATAETAAMSPPAPPAEAPLEPANPTYPAYPAYPAGTDPGQAAVEAPAAQGVVPGAAALFEPPAEVEPPPETEPPPAAAGAPSPPRTAGPMTRGAAPRAKPAPTVRKEGTAPSSSGNRSPTLPKELGGRI